MLTHALHAFSCTLQLLGQQLPALEAPDCVRLLLAAAALPTGARPAPDLLSQLAATAAPALPELPMAAATQLLAALAALGLSKQLGATYLAPLWKTFERAVGSGGGSGGGGGAGAAEAAAALAAMGAVRARRKVLAGKLLAATAAGAQGLDADALLQALEGAAGCKAEAGAEQLAQLAEQVRHPRARLRC